LKRFLFRIAYFFSKDSENFKDENSNYLIVF
jgi:hypothetical protein